MKPCWKDAPEWANYLAMDGDGEWYWWENEPYSSHIEWLNKGGGRCEIAGRPYRGSWYDSLEARQ